MKFWLQSNKIMRIIINNWCEFFMCEVCELFLNCLVRNLQQFLHIILKSLDTHTTTIYANIYILFYIYLINVRAHLKLSQIKLIKKILLKCKLIRIECVCGVEEWRCNSERAIKLLYNSYTIRKRKRKWKWKWQWKWIWKAEAWAIRALAH